MWTQNERARYDQYALAEADNMQMNFSRPTRWQRFKGWVRDNPAKSALLCVLLIGVLVAVIVGPVVGVRNAKSRDDAPEAQSAEYEVAFKLNASDDSGTPLTCDTSSPDTAATRASLASSIAAVLQLPQQQVDVSSVRCQRAAADAGGRRLLQSNVPLVLVAIFRLTASSSGAGSPAGSGSGAPTPSNGTVSGGLPAAADLQALLEAGAARDMLLEALGKALGLPASSITLVGVVATPLGGPPPAPAPSPSAPAPAPSGIYYGGALPPPGSAGVYGSPSPPAYGGAGWTYPPSPSYGG